MLITIASLLLSTASPVDRLADACTQEGTPRSECVCYAAFIEDHATEREVKALATLAEPQNRDSLEKAVNALMAAGLTPGEIFSIGLRVEELTNEASKACKGKEKG
jgi:hypothetical protein